jgi:N-acyl-D-aspartate/D-glutamate deacylase
MLLALGLGGASALALSQLPKSANSTVTNVKPRAASSASQPPSVAGTETTTPVAPDHVFDSVISGGRVIDPETGYDHIANVGIDGGTITTISEGPLNGKVTINAENRVVAPGFIDMISYDPNNYGIWFKISDGVTTNLGMHGMLMTADRFFSTYEGKSPCHYGGAYDNYYMRSDGGQKIGGSSAATPAQIDALTADIEAQLHQGWIGASFSPEYSPGITDDEISKQMTVAAKYGLPSFFHGRYSTDVPPDDNAKTLQEILDLGRQTGSGVHVMHITSTGGTFQMAQSLDTLQKARDADKLDVTACLYPYTFWATYIRSARFSDGWQDRFHITYNDLVVPGTGERLTKATFDHYRATVNKLVAAYAIPEADVVAGLQSPITMVGSDAILEPANNNHPRAAGCFSRTLGYYARDQKTLSLRDALAKMTILPAKRLEAKAPALRKKGRMQQGADADITIFDPATIADRSTVDNPAQESAGIDYVLVLGQVVKSADGLHKDVLPGVAIKSELT